MKFGDAILGRAHRNLSQAMQPVGRLGAIFSQPAVVGFEAGLLEVEVRVIAQQHADGGIDHLGADAVPVLIGEAVLGVPAAAPEIGEGDAAGGDLRWLLAGSRQQA